MERIKRFFKDVYVFANTYREGLSIIISVVIFFTFISYIDLVYTQIFWPSEINEYAPGLFTHMNENCSITSNGEPVENQFVESLGCGSLSAIFSFYSYSFVVYLYMFFHYLILVISLISLIIINLANIISFLSTMKIKIVSLFKKS